MANLLEEGFNPGGLPDPYDIRDYRYLDAPGASIPFDWTQGFDIEQKLGFKLPTKDQNGSFSCGGQAASYYSEVLEALADKTFEERSAKYIYSQVFAPGGGSWMRDVLKLLVNQGCSTEALCPSYENGQPANEAFYERPQDITQEAKQDAQGNKELSYWSVYTDIETVAQAMRDGNGVILLVRGSNNATWRSNEPQPNLNWQWGHWLYAGKTKVENGKKFIGIKNSWGNVGEDGWQWLSEDWFNTTLIQQAWVALFNQASLRTQTQIKILNVLQKLIYLYQLYLKGRQQLSTQ